MMSERWPDGDEDNQYVDYGQYLPPGLMDHDMARRAMAERHLAETGLIQAEPEGETTLAEIAMPYRFLPTRRALDKAIEPITSYPEVYLRMNREALDLMRGGIDRARRGTFRDALIGAGKAAMGGLEYTTSPIDAAVHTIIGKPFEENLGIPHEYSEFVASNLLPFAKGAVRR
jgi:hypothetical protein